MVRRSPIARVVGFLLFMITRPRLASLSRRVWWLVPVVKIVQLVMNRRRTPVHTLRMGPGDEIHVSLKKER